MCWPGCVAGHANVGFSLVYPEQSKLISVGVVGEMEAIVGWWEGA